MTVPQHGLFSHLELKINGTIASKKIHEDMLDCTVENSIHLPDVCTFRLHDNHFEYLNSSDFKEGVDVEVLGGYENTSSLQTLFHGEIVGIEVDMAAHGVPTTLVRCYDRSHRLHRGRYARTYVQVTDTDIVNQVAGDAGLTPNADSTTVVHDWVMQNNQTNWEFLTARAARNGFRLYVTGKDTLNFKKVTDTGATVTLKWGDELRSFRPRINATQQVNQVVVRGWDHVQKQAIVGTTSTAKGTPKVAQTETGAARASGAYGQAKMMVVDRPVFSQSEADAMAQSILDDIGGGYLEADGLTYGNASIKPGSQIEISNIGDRFNGKYFVTGSTHIYSPKEGYSTMFSCSGKRPSTVLAMMDWDGGGRRADMGGNITVGIVTDNKDPDDLGRIKVKYPWLTEDHTSFWARPSNPMGGPQRGWEFVPEIDDEVLVAFEHGDIHRPYILGGLWNGKDKSPLTTDKMLEGGKVVRRVLKTRLGHRFLFKDTDDKGGIALITASNHRIEFHDNDNKILVQTAKGHQVLLDDDGQQIVVKDYTGSNKMTINSSDNSIAIECAGDYSVKAQGQVSIQGQMGISMSTPAQFSASADAGMTISTDAMMSLSADAEMTVSADGPMSLSGAIVNINS